MEGIMAERVRVKVNKGRYATVRAIEISGVATPAKATIIGSTEKMWIYEVWTKEIGDA